MKKKTAKKAIFAFLLFFSLVTLLFPRSVNSQENACPSTITIDPLKTLSEKPVTITFHKNLPSGNYKIELLRGGFFVENGEVKFSVNEKTAFPLNIETPNLEYSSLGFKVNVYLKKDDAYYNLCAGEKKGYLGSYEILEAKGLLEYKCPTMNIIIKGSSHDNTSCIDANSTVTIKFENLRKVYNDGTEEPFIGNVLVSLNTEQPHVKQTTNGNFSFEFGPNLSPTSNSSLSLSILLGGYLGENPVRKEICSFPFPAIHIKCDSDTDDLSNLPKDGVINLGTYDICQGNEECIQCFNEGKAWTAIGCIPTDPTKLIKWAFPYLLGFGGLAAFLLIVFAGIQIMTSSGNPEKLKAGKELITSAITGLIFIILSLFLLRVIGVDILHIPGLK